MFTRLWQTERALLGLLALAVVLRVGVLWRYASQLDEDRDLYRSIAEQLVAGNGYSRVFQWEKRAPMLRYSAILESQLGLTPIDNVGATELTSGSPRPDLPDRKSERSRVFLVANRDPDVPSDLQTNSPFSLPTAYRPPLYPLLIAGTISLFHSHRALAGVHLVLGTLTVGLTVSAARKLKLDRGALVAGLLVALDPLLLHHTPQVMTETLAAFLVTLILWMASWPESLGKRVSLGGTLGLACLCRPTFFVVAAIVFLLDCIQALREKRLAAVVPLWIMGTALFAVILPWGVRNRLVLNHWTVATTHGGYTLYLGHNSVYTTLVVQDETGDGSRNYNEIAAILPELNPLEIPWRSRADFEPMVDQHYSSQAVQYIQENPWDSFRSNLTLLRRMWSVMPTSSDAIPQVVRTAIGLFYGVTFTLALFGLFSLWRVGWRPWLPVLALLIGFTAVHFFYWADMRMRTPLSPAIALLAGLGTERFTRLRARGGESGRALEVDEAAQSIPVETAATGIANVDVQGNQGRSISESA